MSDPNAVTGTHAPSATAPEPGPTERMGRPRAAGGGPSPGSAPVTPAATTPGPQAPERGTDSAATEEMAEPRVGFPRLPPVPGYDVVRFVGRGGMGVVYQAVQCRTGRIVALKIINPSESDDPISRERFNREVRALAGLKHPNIVPVYEAGEWHGFPYCAMEFAPGGTLSAHLERIRGDLPRAVRLVVKVARAVAAMHAAGVLHRDLKPLNILLGANDEPMVADFGLARFVGATSDLTNTGLPVGTRQYMAPEQTLGRRDEYTTACDVWALGVTLFELLTGQRPFADDGPGDLYHSIRSDDPPRCATLAPDVPVELEAIARHCLEKRPEDRYPSAAAVADDLENWLANRSVTAPPLPPSSVPGSVQGDVPSAPTSPQPIVASRRGRVLRAGAVVGVLAVLTALAGFAGVFRTQPPPQKTSAERVAAGEALKLTDNTGAPTGAWTAAEGHELIERSGEGYHWFTSPGLGLAALADAPWEFPIRIEADVAVKYTTEPRARGGVYVARRSWPGLAVEHESLVMFGVKPSWDERPGEKKPEDRRQLVAQSRLYWWERTRPGSPLLLEEKPAPWNLGGKLVGQRFAHVLIELHANQIHARVDGIDLEAVTAKQLEGDLDRKAKERAHFPRYQFEQPTIGTGIGLFCQDVECTVVNLTVSKLNP